MPTYPFFQVDAFSDQVLGGNPCAVVLDADSLSPEQMQAIALEMNLAETAFVRTSSQADVGARYFTPAEEIPLAGHPTVATCFVLAATGRVPLTDPATHMTLELPAGVIPVVLESVAGEITSVTMTQPAPQFQNVYAPEQVLPVFGLDASDLMPGGVIQTVSTGTPMLMVPLRDHDALRRARMNEPSYLALAAKGDFFSPHLFTLGGIHEGDTFARHFGVTPDIPEDPFTGSATGAMACFLWHHGLMDKAAFIAEQGHWMKRPGKAQVARVGTAQKIDGVRVGGGAVMVVEGVLRL